MATGAFRGILMGTAVSVIGLSALSILAGPPQDRMPQPQSAPATGQAAAPVAPSPAESAPDTVPQTTETTTTSPDADVPPATADVDVPAGSGFNAAREDRQAALPSPDTAPQSAPVPALEGDGAPAISALPSTDRTPAAAPQTEQGTDTMAPPPEAGDAPEIATATEQTPSRNAAPSEPQSPAARDMTAVPTIPTVSTGPAQPLADDTAGADNQGQDEPRRPFSDTSPRQEDANGLAAASPLPAQQPAPRRQPLPMIEPAPPAVVPDQDGPRAPQATQAVPDLEPVVRPSIGRPATSLVDRPAPTGETVMSPSASRSAVPLRRNALPFDDSEDRPKLAIVLIDRGDSVVDVEALKGFPYPLTFAIDAARPDAPEASALYRAAGFEVMALVDMAPGSTPQDAEIAIEVSLDAVPDAVAVMEGDATGFQDTAAVSGQIAAILGQRGYGLVMLPNGLNTAQKLAAKDGVPSATVFRDFDGAGQDASAIRRFLDQGAFKAGQQANGLPVVGDGDGVIMLGRLRPDTISALMLWGLQDRAQRVALAPVSAVLGGVE
ncbi:MAG: divergent polysaccharide deacetylase family protein [Paracoccaceae bacterium]